METLAHGIAGSVGGMVAMAILYPLDQVKTIMQVEGQAASSTSDAEEATTTDDNEDAETLPPTKQPAAPAPVDTRSFAAQAIAIVRTKRWQVYQGHVSTQVALGGSNFVYFFCYNGLKAALLKRLHARSGPKALSDAISPLQNLALSCLAGVINVYITAPLWVMNMRLKSKDHTKYAGMLDCLQQIVATEGFLSLWNGTLASLILVSNPVIHYVSYERMKTALQLRRLSADPRGGAALSSWEIFALGALAKSLTTVVTYPLQVAQSLLRVQSAKTAAGSSSKDAPAPSASLSHCLAQIYRTHGVRGYFAGLEAKLLQTVLTAAISLVTYEKLLALILVLLRQTQRPQAIAKAAA